MSTRKHAASRAPQDDAYARARARAKARSAAVTLAGQDIAPLPPIRDAARRARADASFRFFCETYFPHLFYLTGKVNNAAFKGLAAGECLFLGASGSKRGDGDWDITFKFAGSENKTGLTVGDIANIAKKGWEYLWVLYAAAEDNAAKALVQKPVAVYVEKVYEEGDFSQLGIGT